MRLAAKVKHAYILNARLWAYLEMSAVLEVRPLPLPFAAVCRVGAELADQLGAPSVAQYAPMLVVVDLLLLMDLCLNWRFVGEILFLFSNDSSDSGAICTPLATTTS